MAVASIAKHVQTILDRDYNGGNTLFAGGERGKTYFYNKYCNDIDTIVRKNHGSCVGTNVKQDENNKTVITISIKCDEFEVIEQNDAFYDLFRGISKFKLEYADDFALKMTFEFRGV